MMSWLSAVKTGTINFQMKNCDSVDSDDTLISPYQGSVSLKATFRIKLEKGGMKKNIIKLFLYSSRTIMSYIQVESYVDKCNPKKVEILPFKKNYVIIYGSTWNDLFESCGELVVPTALNPNGIYEYYYDISLTIKECCSILMDTSMLTDAGKNGSIVLNKLLTSGEYSDVDIVSNDNQTFKAHQLILKMSSPVFKAMLEAEMKERNENKIVIEDMSGVLIEEMLSYIYTGSCLNIGKNAEDMLAFAEKYMLPGLKDMCERNLIKKISNENIVRLFVIAAKLEAAKLKIGICDFIDRTHCLELLINSDEWKNESCGLLKEYFLSKKRQL